MSVTPAGVNIAGALTSVSSPGHVRVESNTTTSSRQAAAAAAGTSNTPSPVIETPGAAAANLSFKSLVAFALPETAESLLAMAKMAEVCERWDEMQVCMKRLAKLSALEEEFGSDERHLLHVAYRNCILVRRSSWRVAKSVEQRCELDCQTDPGAADKQSALRCAQEFRVTLENEIVDVATDLILLVENVMFPSVVGDEARMFLFKIAGDFYRYLAEVNPSGTFGASVSLYSARAPNSGNSQDSLSQTPLGTSLLQSGRSSAQPGQQPGGGQQQQDEYWVLAQEAYARATELASSLRPSHPMRLGIALNLSIFYYETMRSVDKALHLARQAFTAAIGDDTPPETILEAEANEAGAILQLLQENLFFWTNPNASLDQ